MPRSIRILLVDGTSSGIRTAELSLSTIKALAVPRASLSSVKERWEISKTGVYVLIGADPESLGRKKIYVGEGDSVLTRIYSHSKDEDKNFWDECVLFVSKDDNLTKAHARYLEARFIKLAAEAKRATLTNGTAPLTKDWLPEADEIEMDEFIAQSRLLLGVLGYDVFESASAPNAPHSKNDPAPTQTNRSLQELVCSGKYYDAKCLIDDSAGKFVVVKDSLAKKTEAPTLQPNYKNLRKQLVEIGVLQDVSGSNSYKFLQDYSFGSLSAAAQVVSGTSINGRIAWKTPDGKTFAEWEDAQLS